MMDSEKLSTARVTSVIRLESWLEVLPLSLVYTEVLISP
jgi:hypothetical protein